MALKDTARKIATALGAIANPSQSLAQGQALHAALTTAGASNAERVDIITKLATDPVAGIEAILVLGRQQGAASAKHFDGAADLHALRAQVADLTTERDGLVAKVATVEREKAAAVADVDAKIRKAASTRAMEIMSGLGVPPIAESKTPTTTPGGITGNKTVKDIFAAQVRKAGGSN
jgi:hypothetical protein